MAHTEAEDESTETAQEQATQDRSKSIAPSRETETTLVSSSSAWWSCYALHRLGVCLGQSVPLAADLCEQERHRALGFLVVQASFGPSSFRGIVPLPF